LEIPACNGVKYKRLLYEECAVFDLLFGPYYSAMSILSAPAFLSSNALQGDAVASPAGVPGESPSLSVLLVAVEMTVAPVVNELQRVGYRPQVERVSTLRALRARLQRDEHQVILLEYSPTLPVAEVLKIRGECLSQSPLILIIDFQTEPQALDAMEEGVRDYVFKEHLVRLGPIIMREMRDGAARNERVQIEESLREANAILQATQEAAGEGICLISSDGKVVSFNSYFAQLWKLAPEQAVILQDEEQLFSLVLSRLRDPNEWVDKIHHLFDHPETSTHDEVVLLDGRTLERHSSPAISPGGRSYGRVWSFKDITPHKNYQIQLAHQAFHDSVTGLPNRALFVDRLARTAARVRRSSREAAILFLDLDRFKVVNDSLGHAKGDELLMEVAARIQSCLRPGDTAARFGGDEFTVLLEDIGSTHDAIMVAERVAHAIGAPFKLGTQEVHVSTSIGIVTAGRDAESADELLRKADVAMYRAKQKGRAQYAIFDTQMSALALERLQMEVDLRRTIKGRQLLLHYQPIVDLQRGRIIGTEALARWEHPTRGLVPPFEFVPLAEEIGMILPIGQWVLREACNWTRAWQEQYQPQLQSAREPMVPGAPAVPGSMQAPGARAVSGEESQLSGGDVGAVAGARDAGGARALPPQLTVSVNLSARQFRQPDLVEEIARVLRETELPPHCLMLEITESTVMDDISATVVQLEALKKLGVLLAVDDFGTGYSSLAYLERFPLDCLKVDRAFVSRVGERGERLAIVQAICNLGYALGMRVTAEGLETGGQVSQLRRIGCRAGQGYYFSRPLPADEMTTLLERNPQW
jgi:diguanylate cyclase (GGDEF)-like protein